MSKIMSIIKDIFPYSTSWNWSTFCLYIFVGISVSALCKKGAVYDNKEYSNGELYKKRSGRVYYFFAFLLLVLLATLRTEYVGADTRLYVDLFRQATVFDYDWSKLFSLTQNEPGFLYYIYTIRKITDNYTIYFLITYSFVAWAYVNYIKNHFDKNSDYVFLQIFIFYYVSNMSGARSALATACILFSLTMMKNRRVLKAILLTCIAFLLHYTTIVNLFVLFMVWIFKDFKLKKKRWLWVILIIGSIFVSYVAAYKFKALFVGTKYNYYSSVDIENLSLKGSIFFIAFVVLCIIYYKKMMINAKIKNFIFVPLIASMALAILYPIIYITGAYRIPNYYALPRLVVLSEIINIITLKMRTNLSKYILFKYTLQIFVIMYLLFKFARSASYGYFVYKLIF